MIKTQLNIKYINNQNKELVLSEHPYIYKKYDLLDYQWDMSTTNYIDNRGVKVDRFQTKGKSFKLSLYVRAKTKEEFKRQYERLIETFEADVLNNSPGKLYVNSEYIECYIQGVNKKEYTLWKNHVEIELNIFAPYGKWITEEKYTFTPEITAERKAGKTYANKYAYKYVRNSRGMAIRNNYIVDIPMLIRIFGFAENPAFSIGKKYYKIIDTVEAGEYIEINQKEKTIHKVYADGSRKNIFHKRNKENSVFEKLEVGEQSLVTSGAFGINVITYTERSEPIWL